MYSFRIRRIIQTIDKWVDKFRYILCSLKKQTDNNLFGLTRRFESRIILSIIINYGININHINKYSAKAKKRSHDIDLKITKNNS